MTTDEDQVPELTAEDARSEVERLSTELYWAQDRIAFISECLDASEHDGITTLPITRIRRWLDGPRCSHQPCAPAPDHDELRKRIAAAIGRIGLILPIGHRLAAAGHVLHVLRPTLAQAARLEPAIVEQERQAERADKLTALLTVILDNDSDLLPGHRVTQIEACLSPDHGQHCHAPATQPDTAGAWAPDDVTCRRMETCTCPPSYGRPCGERPCARFESDDPTPWLATTADEASYYRQLSAEQGQALSRAEASRAEAQRDRDQHAAVLREVLAAFVHNVEGYHIPRRSAEADVVTLEKWRSTVAPTVERPWWEQVALSEEAAVDATQHVLELKATIERVRATTAYMRSVTRTWDPAADFVDAALDESRQAPSEVAHPETNSQASEPRTVDEQACHARSDVQQPTTAQPCHAVTEADVRKDQDHMHPVEELRAAAARLRELATAASTDNDGTPTTHWHAKPGWPKDDDGNRFLYGDHLTRDDGRTISWPLLLRGGMRRRAPYMHGQHADYAAAMDPTVGLALALLLEGVASSAVEDAHEECAPHCSPETCDVSAALAVARAINGGQR